MNISIAITDNEIAACYAIMQELRSHIGENDFVSRIRRQEQSGYQLIYLENETALVAVAGFRIAENLAWGRFLYVDDLVTSNEHRSQGYGAKLLAWMREYASSEGCAQMHLDSGLQRAEAHRFYEREGMSKTGFHFAQHMAPHNALNHTPTSGAV